MLLAVLPGRFQFAEDKLCSMLVQVSHSLDPVEYREFLEKRREVVKEELRVAAEKQAAKVLRTG